MLVIHLLCQDWVAAFLFTRPTLRDIQVVTAPSGMTVVLASSEFRKLEVCLQVQNIAENVLTVHSENSKLLKKWPAMC